MKKRIISLLLVILLLTGILPVSTPAGLSALAASEEAGTEETSSTGEATPALENKTEDNNTDTPGETTGPVVVSGAPEVSTPTPDPTATPTPSPTPEETETPSPTPEETETPSPTPEETETPSPTPVSPAELASGECGAQGDNLTWVLSEVGVLTISVGFLRKKPAGEKYRYANTDLLIG